MDQLKSKVAKSARSLSIRGKYVIATDSRPLGAPLGLDPPGGFIFVRACRRRALRQKATRDYSVTVFIPSSVEPPACLVDLVNRSNFVGRVALAHYCIDER